MAIYSLALMQHAGNQLVYDKSNTEGYLVSSFIVDTTNELVSNKPLIHYEQRAGKAGNYYVTARANAYSLRITRQASSFDPFAGSRQVDPVYNVLNIKDGRLILDLMGWVNRAGLVAVLTNPSFQRSSWELGVYYYRDTYSKYVKEYYPITRVGVAVRSIHDEDIPENWVGSPQPDMRFVIDPADTSYKMEFTDLLYDATSLFCESKRYVFDGDDYRASFVQAPYSPT